LRQRIFGSGLFESGFIPFIPFIPVRNGLRPL
jgi:hypothetical protein